MITDQDLAVISDLHKDAKGFRPSPAFWARWKTLSRYEQEKIYTDLVAELEQVMEADRAREQASIDRFEARVRVIVESGKDRNAAIRQIVMEVEPDTRDCDMVCYRLGLPFEMRVELYAAME